MTHKSLIVIFEVLWIVFFKVAVKRLLLLSAFYSIPSSALIMGDNFYLGIAAGVFAPTKGSVKFDKIDLPTKSDIKSTFKTSGFYSVKAGFSLIPGFSLEFAGDYKPKLPMQIDLEDYYGSVKTKAREIVGIVNIVYNLIDIKGFEPYAFVGVGLAQLKFSQAKVTKNDQDSFILKKGTSIRPAWQIGAGITKAVFGDFVKIDGSVTLRSAVNVKGKYKKLLKGGEFGNGEFKRTLSSLNIKLGLTLSI